MTENEKPIKILYAESEEGFGDLLVGGLEDDSREFHFIHSIDEIRNAVRTLSPHMIIIGFYLHYEHFVHELVKEIKVLLPETAVVLLSAKFIEDINLGGLAYKNFYYVPKGDHYHELIAIKLERIINLCTKSIKNSTEKNNDCLPKADTMGKQGLTKFTRATNFCIKHLKNITKKNDYNIVLPQTDTIEEICNDILKYAKFDKTPILIRGGSDDDKQLIAKYIHKASSNHNEPFIMHTSSRKLAIDAPARNGTIFLNEVGSMNNEVQKLLLQAMDNPFSWGLAFLWGDVDVNRIKISFNGRFIFGTNKDLEKLVKKSKFINELYYSIKVIDIRLPSFNDEQKKQLSTYFGVKTLQKNEVSQDSGKYFDGLLQPTTLEPL